MTEDAAPSGDRSGLHAALALALAAAVSLGLARFSYALLLPPMRSDLGWSYFTGGLMNTANAAGYLAGALLAGRLLARVDARTLLVGSGIATAAMLAAHGLVSSDGGLLVMRVLAGLFSAGSVVAGGLLAARLASRPGARGSGLVLGLYYGGTGLGIVTSAWLVPPLTADGSRLGWQSAWWAIGAAALIATLLTSRGTGGLQAPPLAARATRARFAARPLLPALGGYLMFGIGYIGYMTFIVTLLREQGLGSGAITVFYTLIGVGVVGSSWLWAGLLQRQRGGGAMALLNGLLALATLLPVVSTHPVAVFVSGALFGSVFLSVVASTTALVRHNLPAAAWPAGIAVFTVVFALGQIVGPGLVGLIADGPGGLLRGFAVSAGVLALGSVLAALQRPLGAGRA